MSHNAAMDIEDGSLLNLSSSNFNKGEETVASMGSRSENSKRTRQRRRFSCRSISLVIVLSSLCIFFLSRSSRPSSLDFSHNFNYKHFGGAINSGTFVTDGSITESSYHIAAVADLDHESSDESGNSFHSFLKGGILTRLEAGGYSLDWGLTQRITTKHNEAGRGMELSELIVFDDRLLTFGDRTGIVFELLKKSVESSSESASQADDVIKSVPRFIFTEGDGETDKGMKIEWATLKDKKLYVGSFGKEYTSSQGEIINTNNNWIVVIDHEGHVSRHDWGHIYDKVRSVVGCDFPGYLVHEAVLWSPFSSKWVFLPRRVSQTPYDEVEDERKGSNIVITADDRFVDFNVVEVGVKLGDEGEEGLRGFR